MKLKETVISLLYPKKCPFCTRLIDEKADMCVRCEKKLPFIPSSLQPRKSDFVDECYSVFYYREIVQDSILRYKFGHATGYSSIYGKFLRKCIDENSISCDIISWVPLSRKRLRKRGYDQAKLLADECAVYYGTRSEAVLRKVRDTKAQSGIPDAKTRKANVKGAYIVKDDSDVAGKIILLLDDVVTTSATVSECAKMLKQAGAARVIVLSVAAVFQ